MLEDGEDGGHGASNVGGVESHGNMDDVIGAGIVVVGGGGDGFTGRGIVKLGSFFELVSESGSVFWSIECNRGR